MNKNVKDILSSLHQLPWNEWGLRSVSEQLEYLLTHLKAPDWNKRAVQMSEFVLYRDTDMSFVTPYALPEILFADLSSLHIVSITIDIIYLLKSDYEKIVSLVDLVTSLYDATNFPPVYEHVSILPSQTLVVLEIRKHVELWFELLDIHRNIVFSNWLIYMLADHQRVEPFTFGQLFDLAHNRLDLRTKIAWYLGEVLLFRQNLPEREKFILVLRQWFYSEQENTSKEHFALMLALLTLNSPEENLIKYIIDKLRSGQPKPIEHSYLHTTPIHQISFSSMIVSMGVEWVYPIIQNIISSQNDLRTPFFLFGDLYLYLKYDGSRYIDEVTVIYPSGLNTPNVIVQVAENSKLTRRILKYHGTSKLLLETLKLAVNTSLFFKTATNLFEVLGLPSTQDGLKSYVEHWSTSDKVE